MKVIYETMLSYCLKCRKKQKVKLQQHCAIKSEGRMILLNRVVCNCKNQDLLKFKKLVNY